MLQPPPIDPSTAEGRASRTALLRAWVEISAWLAVYREANGELHNIHSEPAACRAVRLIQ